MEALSGTCLEETRLDIAITPKASSSISNMQVRVLLPWTTRITLISGIHRDSRDVIERYSSWHPTEILVALLGKERRQSQKGPKVE